MGTGSHARMQRAQSAEYTRELLTMPGWSSLSIFCCQRAPVLGWHAHIDNLSFLPPARPVPAKSNFPARTWNWGIFSNYYIRIELQIDCVFFCLFVLSPLRPSKPPYPLMTRPQRALPAIFTLLFWQPAEVVRCQRAPFPLSFAVRWHQSTIMKRPEKLLNLNHRISTTLWESCSWYDISTLRDSFSLFLRVYVSF